MSENALRARIVDLECEVERLRAENIAFKSADKTFIFPAWFHLTPNEAALLDALMRNRIVTLGIYETFKHTTDEPQKLLQVYVCKLRKKMEPFEIEIRNVRQQGYCLDEVDKRRLSALMRDGGPKTGGSAEAAAIAAKDEQAGWIA